jgi:hypothetical protein
VLRVSLLQDVVPADAFRDRVRAGAPIVRAALAALPPDRPILHRSEERTRRRWCQTWRCLGINPEGAPVSSRLRRIAVNPCQQEIGTPIAATAKRAAHAKNKIGPPKAGNDHKANSVEPTVPEAGAAQDELVDKASEESFPASDPPSYWQRESNEEQRRASKEQEGDSVPRRPSERQTARLTSNSLTPESAYRQADEQWD